MKKILLLISCLTVSACGAAEMAAFTGVGFVGSAINYANRESDITADDVIDSVTDSFKKDKNTSFELN